MEAYYRLALIVMSLLSEIHQKEVLPDSWQLFSRYMEAKSLNITGTE